MQAGTEAVVDLKVLEVGGDRPLTKKAIGPLVNHDNSAQTSIYFCIRCPSAKYSTLLLFKTLKLVMYLLHTWLLDFFLFFLKACL